MRSIKPEIGDFRNYLKPIPPERLETGLMEEGT